jgi:hypothetical protein
MSEPRRVADCFFLARFSVHTPLPTMPFDIAILSEASTDK